MSTAQGVSAPRVPVWRPLLLFAGLALVFWGPWVLGAPRTTILGDNDVDPSVYLWFFSWWPHALLEGANPFYTGLIFVPEGYNLAWVTSMPGPSLLLAPVTLALGPVVTWNLISFAAPVLSAWTAFVLCRRLTGALGPSLAGGYLFGFSPYMLGALTGAPQLALVALLPVFVLLVVGHVEGSISDRRFPLLMALALAAQAYTSTEVLATSALFGTIALIGALALAPALRAALWHTIRMIALAGVLAGLLAAPLLYYVAFDAETLPEHALTSFPADLLAFFVPAGLVAASPAQLGIADPGWAGSSYLGLPLVVLAGLFVWRYRSRLATRLLALGLAVSLLACLGPALHVAGERTDVPLPWELVGDLPLLRYAIPLRFSVFAFLAAALIVALWLAWRPSVARWALVAVVIVSLLPAIGSRAWHTDLAVVPFFAEGGYEDLLLEGDRVLTMPARGRNMHWQAQADFSFELAGGYVGQDPESYARYAVWHRLLAAPVDPGSGRAVVRSPGDLRRFIAAKGVTVIVAQDGVAPELVPAFEALDPRPLEAGGARLYRVAQPPAG